MRCLCCLTFITVLFIFPFGIARGQSAIASDKSPFLSAKTYYEDEIKEDTHLYTGKEYYAYPSGVQGSPFFLTDQAQNTDIFYEGNLYRNIPVLFDIARQVAVVINQYQHGTRIQLLSEKIKYFTFGGHRFESIALSEEGGDKINKGLFDVPFTGATSVLVRRVKNLKKGLRAEDPYTFREEDEYYLKKGKNIYSAADKKAVMQAFDDKKDLIKMFVRKNNLKFKKNIEKDLIMTAAYYSTLN